MKKNAWLPAAGALWAVAQLVALPAGAAPQVTDDQPAVVAPPPAAPDVHVVTPGMPAADLPTLKGTIADWHHDAKGKLDGFTLDSGAMVSFPAAAADQIAAIASPGAKVTVSGTPMTGKNGETMLRAQAITAVASGQQVVIVQGPALPAKGGGAGAGLAAPKAPAVDKPGAVKDFHNPMNHEPQAAPWVDPHAKPVAKPQGGGGGGVTPANPNPPGATGVYHNPMNHEPMLAPWAQPKAGDKPKADENGNQPSGQGPNAPTDMGAPESAPVPNQVQ